MGLQSAMTTALTGLQAAETTIDVVGNNVANSNTVGFKESDALFATQFLQTQSIGSAPTGSRGGTNPRQIGLGVKVAAINPDFTQGTIEISANPLDVAIQGDGFLMVQGLQGERLYTRNGQLQTNANNEIVSVTGQRVLGYGIDDEFNIIETLVPLQIPLGEETVAQATETAVFSGNLSPTADVADTPSIIESVTLGNGDPTLEVPTNDASGTDLFDSGDFQTVSSPNTSGSTGGVSVAGTLNMGDYDYRVAWFVNSGSSTYESAPSGLISVPGVANNEQVTLSSLPVDGSGLWDGRRIYRSMDGGDFELLDTIDATSGTYVDNSAATLGTPLDMDALDNGNYSYYVTFAQSGGTVESRPTARIGPFAVSDSSTRIRIDDLPQPTSGSFDTVNIYRNLATNSSEFHLVDSLPIGETTFIDNTPDADIIGNPEVDLIGPKASGGTLLTEVVVREGNVYTTPFVEGTLNFTGQKGDRTLATKQLDITATTTVQDLIEFMDESFGIDNPIDSPFSIVPGGDIPGGQLTFTSNMGIANALDVGLSAFTMQPTGSTTATPISIGFTETQPANGAGTITDFVVYDTLGIPVTVRLTTALEAKDGNSTTYRWYATSGVNEPATGVDTVIGNGLITFDGAGRIVSGGTPSIAVDRLQTASQSPLEFDLDFSMLRSLDERNNFTEPISTLNMTRQDGFPPGTLTSFVVTESGLIRGVFSNGTERALGQIRMVQFANNTGLQQVGDNMFVQGVNSGEPIEGNPGDRGIGTLTAGAVELSNTDIGQNLIELILASTQYRGGTRVITTAQQLLDELMSLRR